MELTHHQIEKLAHRFPKLELSYETFAQKKVSSNYDICISIPNGKKQFAWFTYYGDTDVVYLMDINKEQKVSKMVMVTPQIKGNPNNKFNPIAIPIISAKSVAAMAISANTYKQKLMTGG